MGEEHVDLIKDITDLKIWRATAQEQHLEMVRRIEDNASLLESFRELASSVKQMTVKMDTMSRDIEKIKNRPIERWGSILEKILFTAIGVLVSWLLKQFGIF